MFKVNSLSLIQAEEPLRTANESFVIDNEFENALVQNRARLLQRLRNKPRKLRINDAEDIVQQTMIEALLKKESFKESGKNFSKWLNAIARKQIEKLSNHPQCQSIEPIIAWQRDRMFRPNGQTSMEDRRIWDGLATPDDHFSRSVEREDAWKIIVELIDELPETTRTVLQHLFDGHRVNEIAQMMEMTPNAVSKRIGLARQKLQKHFSILK